jgi:hypothetical protein
MASDVLRTEVVASAIERLRVLDPESTSFQGQWTFHRTERARSTIYRIEDGNGSTLYYKQLHSEHPEQGHEKPDSLASRLARSQDLSDRLIEITRGSKIYVAPVLAVDEEHLTIVTLGLAGRELGRGVGVWGAFDRRGSSKRVRLLGQACALIDTVGEESKDPVDLDAIDSILSRRLQVAELSDVEFRRVRKFVMSLAERCVDRGASAYVHGDLSASNVLRTDRGVGLIDFSWRIHFRGFDAGVLNLRLASMHRWSPTTGDRLRRILVDEYRRRAGASFDPDVWRLVNLILLVRGLRAKSPRIVEASRTELRAIARGATSTKLDLVIEPDDPS